MNYIWKFFNSPKDEEKKKQPQKETKKYDLSDFEFDYNPEPKKETNTIKQTNDIKQTNTTKNFQNVEDEPIEEMKKDVIDIPLNINANNNDNIKKEIIEQKKEIITEDTKEIKEIKEKEVIQKDNNNENNQTKKTKKKKIKKVKNDKINDKNLNVKTEEQEEIKIIEENKNQKENNVNVKKPAQEIKDEININNQEEKNQKIFLDGPENSPYENGHFEVSINYDKDNKLKPVIKFLTKIYHYNIAQKTGEILCPFIWNENKNEEDNIKNIKTLLLRPDTRYPCSKFIKDEYYNNYPTYKEKAQKITENYAMN